MEVYTENNNENHEQEISNKNIEKIDNSLQKLLNKIKKNNENMEAKDAKITFIIPTIGRSTLEQSVKSILNQTNSRWELIIVFDGVEPNYFIENDKIRIMKLEKKLGEGYNSAGNVRNYAMQFVNTPWIGFLDDDDIISPLYVKTFLNEKKFSLNNGKKLDVIIFRMYDRRHNSILPHLHQKNFYINEVGISFAFKTKLFHEGKKLVPSSGEDFYFLNNLRNSKKTIMISPYIMYFVRANSLKIPKDIESKLGERGYIN